MDDIQEEQVTKYITKDGLTFYNKEDAKTHVAIGKLIELQNNAPGYEKGYWEDEISPQDVYRMLYHNKEKAIEILSK